MLVWFASPLVGDNLGPSHVPILHKHLNLEHSPKPKNALGEASTDCQGFVIIENEMTPSCDYLQVSPYTIQKVQHCIAE